MAKKKQNALRLSDVQKGWIGVAILALAFGVYAFTNFQTATADGMLVRGSDPSKGVSLNLSEDTVVRVLGKLMNFEVQAPVEETLGAVAGPDIPFRWFSVGGVRSEFGRMGLNTVTTTPCAIQAPNATSSLVSTQLRVSTASSTATVWHVAKATSAFATTTLLRNPISLGSGALGTMQHIASTSDTAIDSVDIFGPGEWLVWGAKGFLPANSTLLNGFCQAEFRVVR